MPQKRRSSRNEQHADRDNFLQTFEKPTQIYRYLRSRNLFSPIFLHRTLTYMPQRMSRSHKKRSTFRINDLLTEKLKSLKRANCPGDFLSLVFLGFFEKAIDSSTSVSSESVRVESMLLKISYKKRKESSSSNLKTLGMSEVTVGSCVNQKVPVLSLSTDMFDSEDGQVTHILLFRVETLTGVSQLFGTEMMIFDKYGRCLLTEGEYQLTLQEINQPTLGINGKSPRKYSSWENLTMFTGDPSTVEESFDRAPILKFMLYWTEKSHTGILEYADLGQFLKNHDVSNKENDPGVLMQNNNHFHMINYKTHRGVNPIGHNIFGIPENKLQIAYQFVYNNVPRQTTEPSPSLKCPWCYVNCMTLYSLLKHLQLSHARFTFSFVQVGNVARIDVGINDSFDGGYMGSPHDLVGPAGLSFPRVGPTRRTSVTRILVCRPRRQKPSLSEFLETEESELNGQRPYITGHNRLYHHTMTCLPVHPKELDIDSEGECDPPWLQKKTIQMIDEFTDVNEGEKELMKLWNLHVMKHGFVGDCQIPLACDMFVELKGHEILKKNLYRNFVLHMCSLFDYGLVAPDAYYKTMQKLQKMLSGFPDGKDMLSDARRDHLQQWNEFGVQKHMQQQIQQKEERKGFEGGVKGKDTKDAKEGKDKDAFAKPKTECRGVAIKSASNATQKRKLSTSMRSSANGQYDSGKRKLSERDDIISPPRRRSSSSAWTNVGGGEKRAKMELSRRKSFGGAANGTTKTRLSVSLTKVDRELGNRK
ncbi:Polycomb protein Su(z)12 [Sergentomyia squamirostris]